MTLVKKKRESNLELYRIIVMILIVAHHYVVNSGLIDLIHENAGSRVASTMLLFGAWGKTGIDCFVLITGYFLCKSIYNWNKLLKLYLQIVFYGILIYAVFCLTGHESFSIFKIIGKIFPIKSISTGFTSCFLVFYLFIPFINILIKNLNQKNHLYLLALLLGVYTILPSIPGFTFTFNYVGWFVTIYILAAYLRNYSGEWEISHKQWGLLSLSLLGLGSISVLAFEMLYSKGYVSSYAPYFLISDSNKIFAVLISVSTFMWFKGLRLPYIPLINLLGGATFGVLLIHANSNAMRQWLWKEIVDCTGHFGDNVLLALGYALGSVLIIFTVCSFIEILRAKFIEPKYLNYIESKIKRATTKLAIS